MTVRVESGRERPAYSARGTRGAAGRTTTGTRLGSEARKRDIRTSRPRSWTTCRPWHTSPTADPGPWILLFPLVWALVIGVGVALLRRTVWRGRVGPGRPRTVDGSSPIAVLGHRFASGEIDEDEYWRRLSVLDDQFGRAGRGGPA